MNGNSNKKSEAVEAERNAAVRKVVDDAPTNLSETQKQTLQELLRGAGSSTRYGKSSSRRDRVPRSPKPVVLPENDVQPPVPPRRPRKPKQS